MVVTSDATYATSVITSIRSSHKLASPPSIKCSTTHLPPPWRDSFSSETPYLETKPPFEPKPGRSSTTSGESSQSISAFPIVIIPTYPRVYRLSDVPCREIQTDSVFLYSEALKKLISELPSMTEQDLTAAGELGTSPPQRLKQTLCIDPSVRLPMPYMLRIVLCNLGRTRDGRGYGFTRPPSRSPRDHPTFKDVWPHILSQGVSRLHLLVSMYLSSPPPFSIFS